MCRHCNCSLIRSLRLASFKVCLCVIVLLVTICTVGYVCLFRRHQTFVNFISFLSMIIYEVVYILSWCLRYTICSAWLLDIRISTYFASMSYVDLWILEADLVMRSLSQPSISMQLLSHAYILKNCWNAWLYLL